MGRRDDTAVTVLDQLPLPILLFDGPSHVVSMVSEGCRSLFGDLAGKPPAEALPALAERGIEALVHKVFATGREFRGEGWEIGDVGRGIGLVVDIALSPYRAPDGSMRGVIGSLVTVGDRPARADTAARPAPSPAPPRAGAMRGASSGAPPLQLLDVALPRGLPVLPGLEVAAQYVLADPRRPGGDWFDALALPGGGVALVVGDVVGRGLEATAVMSRLRTVMRERLLAGDDLEATLHSVGQFAAADPAARAATACLVLLDPVTGSYRYSTVGHPPPLIVDRGRGAAFLTGSGSAPLGSGAAGQRVAVGEGVLGDGAVLLLYTDGILASPGRPVVQATVDLSLAAADAVAARAPKEPWSTVERLCRTLAQRLVGPSGLDDDLVLLAAQRVPEWRPLELSLPALPDTVRVVRAELGAWLTGMGVRAVDELALLHSVGELVRNVVDHAYADRQPSRRGQVDVTARLDPGGQVRILVIDDGVWQHHRRDPSRGRGLALAGGLVDRLTVRGGAQGTRVELSHSVSRTVDISLAAPSPRPRATSRPGELEADETEGRLGLRGPVDEAAAERLRGLLLRGTRAGTVPLEVDLTEATMLTSAGVRALLDLLAGCPEADVQLVAAAGSVAQRVLDVVQLPYRIAPVPAGDHG